MEEVIFSIVVYVLFMFIATNIHYARAKENRTIFGRPAWVNNVHNACVYGFLHGVVWPYSLVFYMLYQLARFIKWMLKDIIAAYQRSFTLPLRRYPPDSREEWYGENGFAYDPPHPDLPKHYWGYWSGPQPYNFNATEGAGYLCIGKTEEEAKNHFVKYYITENDVSSLIEYVTLEPVLEPKKKLTN